MYSFFGSIQDCWLKGGYGCDFWVVTGEAGAWDPKFERLCPCSFN